LVERRPGDLVTDVALLLESLALKAIVERTERPTFPEDLEGHALTDVRLRTAVREERIDRPGQHVDEPRRDGEPARVDLLRALALHRADRGDAIAIDREVATDRRTPASVVEHAAAKDDVVVRGHRSIVRQADAVRLREQRPIC